MDVNNEKKQSLSYKESANRFQLEKEQQRY